MILAIERSGSLKFRICAFFILTYVALPQPTNASEELLLVYAADPNHIKVR